MKPAGSIFFLLAMMASVVALAAPPKVVKAIPDNGQTDVDPATKEILVEFDQPMNTVGRSIIGGGETFPKSNGNPRWINPKTIIIPVKLEPEHEYWLSINNDNFKNFTNKQGESAEPYPIGFFTAKARAAAKPAASAPAGDNQAAIDALRKAIDEDYSYRDRLKVDWDKQFQQQQSKLASAATPNEFARAAAAVLRNAQDGHVFLRVGEQSIYTSSNPNPPNFNLESLKKLVPGWTETAAGVVTGKFPDGIGYILVPQWTDEQPPAVEAALAGMKDVKALILDVRCNGGGDELAAAKVAGLFVPKAAVYSKNRYKQAGQWGEVFDRVIEPRKDHPRFDKPVALLIGPKCVSSNESFVLMMKQDPQCTLIGAATRGSSGNPKPHDLGNGVTVFLSSWEDQLPDGTVLEGKGISPDVQVKTRLADFVQQDPVLQAARKQLREAKK